MLNTLAHTRPTHNVTHSHEQETQSVFQGNSPRTLPVSPRVRYLKEPQSRCIPKQKTHIFITNTLSENPPQMREQKLNVTSDFNF